MRRIGSACIALLTLATSSALAEPARPAPDEQACIEAYEAAQRFARRAQLARAGEALGVCLDAACPSQLRSDCGQWLQDVEARQPSVLLEARHAGAGADVQVTMDGVAVAAALDGRAIEADPGPHDFIFSTPARAPVSVRYVVREGERRQRIVGEFAQHPPSRKATETPLSVYLLAGTGVAFGAAFGVAAGAGFAGRDDLAACRPDCASDRVADVRTKFLIADVFLASALVSFGLAAVLYVTTKGRARTSSIARLTF